MLRVDTHHHMIPPDYRDMLRRAGIDEAGGRALPDWSPEGSLQTMAELDMATAILSVSTPGTTFLSNRADAAALARDLNDYGADLVAAQPERFGFFATVPMPTHRRFRRRDSTRSRRTQRRRGSAARQQRRHLPR
jgi:hypothetical protein